MLFKKHLRLMKQIHSPLKKKISGTCFSKQIKIYTHISSSGALPINLTSLNNTGPGNRL